MSCSPVCDPPDSLVTAKQRRLTSKHARLHILLVLHSLALENEPLNNGISLLLIKLPIIYLLRAANNIRHPWDASACCACELYHSKNGRLWVRTYAERLFACKCEFVVVVVGWLCTWGYRGELEMTNLLIVAADQLRCRNRFSCLRGKRQQQRTAQKVLFFG